jgi:D-alanine-D-alanine ligase-like ATP-grasp enzyme
MDFEMNLQDIPNTNSQILIETARKMGIKVELLDQEKVKLRLTKNNKTHIVTKKSFGINPSKAIKLTRNKNAVAKLLNKHNIPTPYQIEIHSLKELKTKRLPPFPIVLKPAEGQKAHDVYVSIKDEKKLYETAKLAFRNIQANKLKSYNLKPSIIIQEYIQGSDLRFFVLNGKVIAAARRHPPKLIGDGKHTIKELIHFHNQRLLKEREKIGRRMQNRILNWPRVIWHLENQGLSLQTILPKEKTITPYPIANFQAGGTAETIPIKKVPSSITQLAEKIATLTKLKVCGIDMIITPSDPNIDCSCENCKCTDCLAYFIEINSDPSLRLHEWPNRGTPQPVTASLLNYFFTKFSA